MKNFTERKLVYLDDAIDAVCMEWCNVKHQDCKHPFDDEKDDYYWCDGCETVLRTLPDLPPAQQWIPCSERLPEDGENVLVTYKTTDKIHPCQYHDDGSRNPWYSYIDQCRAHMNVVLAWMPLPEPYREEGEE